MFPFRRLLAALCLLLFLGGCGGSGESPAVQPVGDVQMRVFAGPMDAMRHVLILTVTITNTGSRAITLGSANATIFEVEVDDASGNRLWNYGLVNIPQPTQVTLAPGEEKIIPVRWNAEDSQGMNLKPGSYRVKAALVPKTLNGAALSVPQQNALPSADTQATVTTQFDPTRPWLFEPGAVLFSLNSDQDTSANRNLILTAGTIRDFFEPEHHGGLVLKPGVSGEAGIVFLQTFAFVRFAELNYYVYAD